MLLLINVFCVVFVVVVVNTFTEFINQSLFGIIIFPFYLFIICEFVIILLLSNQPKN